MPLVLVVVAVILSVMQNRAKAAGEVDFVSRTAKGAVSIIQTPVAATLDWTGNFFSGIVSAPSLNRENIRLRARAAELYALESRLAEEIEKNERLSQLLKIPDQKERNKVAAKVIGYDFINQRLQLNVGTRDGVKAGDPVIIPEGLVGQVVEVGSRSSFVNLLTHSASSVGARVSGGSVEAVGIVKGNGSPTLLLEVFVEESEIKTNDLLVTSGVSAVYPAALRIGIITNVWLDRDYGLRKAIVQPFFKAAALREVVVLTR
ncbi:MAG: rod shape-determining protein MreC [Fimbriimonadales bacterium]|nr:rod shape-determining protein MreC [Fimbriimonadales bacterium]